MALNLSSDSHIVKMCPKTESVCPAVWVTFWNLLHRIYHWCYGSVCVCVFGDMTDERPSAKTPQHNIKFDVMEIDIDLFIQIFIMFTYILLYILLSFTIRWNCKMSLICFPWLSCILMVLPMKYYSIHCFESTEVSLHLRADFLFSKRKWFTSSKLLHNIKWRQTNNRPICFVWGLRVPTVSMLNAQW